MFRKIGHAVKPKQSDEIAKVLIPHHPDSEKDPDLTPRQVLDSGVDEEALSWEHATDTGVMTTIGNTFARPPRLPVAMALSMTPYRTRASQQQVTPSPGERSHPSGTLRTVYCAHS